ncbi:MAG: hypothetical protein HRT38_00755 [Alteromonadaceae bacterium]|nr:hypothetical protein [Alteromonadaceae bacterium]
MLSSYMAVIFRCLVTKENNLQYSQEVLIDLCNLDQEVSKEKSIINDTDLHHHFDECLAKLVNLQLIESV